MMQLMCSKEIREHVCALHFNQYDWMARLNQMMCYSVE